MAKTALKRRLETLGMFRDFIGYRERIKKAMPLQMLDLDEGAPWDYAAQIFSMAATRESVNALRDVGGMLPLPDFSIAAEEIPEIAGGDGLLPIEVFRSEKMGGRETLEWVAANMRVRIDAGDCPNSTAFGWLEWARANPDEFWKSLAGLARATDRVDQTDRMRLDGSAAIETARELVHRHGEADNRAAKAAAASAPRINEFEQQVARTKRPRN